MRFTTLSEWLSWQEGLHPSEIELGLERVASVWQRLRPSQHNFTVITVGGTNGKGSTVALLESLYCAGGYRVGAYTSPHLLRYNERIRIDAVEIDDNALCHSFDRIDQARGETSLTYFEFGTLAALDLFVESGVDIVLLEVGLGGRLDAANIVDADVAVITSVGIDHTAWLGSDREVIGFEKAGIFRPERAAICGDPEPPQRLLEHAAEIGAPLQTIGNDFGYELIGSDRWCWWSGSRRLEPLLLPALAGRFQLNNAAVALAVVERLHSRHPLNESDIARGLNEVSLTGRFQRFPGAIERLLDVAHNPHAARVLAQSLDQTSVRGRTIAVVAMLDDKDVEGVVAELHEVIDLWYVAGIDQPRGLSAQALAARFAAIGIKVEPYATPALAWQVAESVAAEGDRLVGFGSFLTVAKLLPLVL